MAVSQNKLKIVIFDFFYHYYEISEQSCLILVNGTLAGLRSRPLAQVTMDSELITILAQRPFK
jgi:hypothetical protein